MFLALCTNIDNDHYSVSYNVGVGRVFNKPQVLRFTFLIPLPVCDASQG